jgi:hypothetical protein
MILWKIHGVLLLVLHEHAQEEGQFNADQDQRYGTTDLPCIWDVNTCPAPVMLWSSKAHTIAGEIYCKAHSTILKVQLMLR